MIGMGFVEDHGQLSACRVILGVLEAGFFPSAVYLLSTWYTRCKSILYFSSGHRQGHTADGVC
jgi:MFS family permease